MAHSSSDSSSVDAFLPVDQGAPNPATRLRLSRLTIHKFRRVEPTTLVFNPSFNVVLGINASGKTSLLKLVSACLRGDFSLYRNEEFDVEFEILMPGAIAIVQVRNVPGTEHAQHRHRNSLQHESAPLRASVQLALKYSGGELLRVSLPLIDSVRDREGNELKPEYAAGVPILGPGVVVGVIDAMWSMTSASSPLDIIYSSILLGLEQGHLAYRFDESSQFMDALCGLPDHSTDDGVPAFSLLLYLDRSARMLQYYLSNTIGISVEKALEAVQGRQGVIESGSVRLDSSELPWLDNFNRTAGFNRSELTLLALSEELRGESIRVDMGAPRFRFQTSHDDTYIAEGLLSYGQRRLLSFLAYVTCNPAVIVADELVNGLHHDWITACLDAIGERQAFLTSQNPLLLDYLGPGSAKETQERFIQCKLEEREGKKVMVWKNLEPAVAADFYRDYSAGIMQVSELLRVHGVW